MEIKIDEKKIYGESLAEFLKYKPDTYFIQKCPTDIIEDIHRIIEFAIHRIDRIYKQKLELAKKRANQEFQQDQDEKKQKSFFEELENIPQEKKAKVLDRIMIK